METLVTRLRRLSGARLLVTGHTGFKGGWLVRWAHRLGCEVHGLALPPDQAQQRLFSDVSDCLATSSAIDVRDAEAVMQRIAAVAPDAIIHLAGQSLVSRALADPVGTFATNIMGTVHLLDAARRIECVRALVIATSDKCYRNHNEGRAFAEQDQLGGDEPYGASKAAAEMAIAAYRHCYPELAMRLASGRAGNVMGGGDFSPGRIVPDLVRAMAANAPLVLRAPDATRPWQHVLEPVSGYLLLVAELLAGNRQAADAFNFGPRAEDAVPVAALVSLFARHFGKRMPQLSVASRADFTEARLLALDSARARQQLGWQLRLPLEEAAGFCATWYAAWLDGLATRPVMDAQIARYEALEG